VFGLSNPLETPFSGYTKTRIISYVLLSKVRSFFKKPR
jgi:hypothetical protein